MPSSSRFGLLWIGLLLSLLPACVIERIDRILAERGVTWDPGASTTDTSSTGSTSTGSTSSTSASSTSGAGEASGESVGAATATSGDNTNDSDATSESGESSATDVGLHVCGDGIVDPGESCDDANDDPDDGCKLCTRDSVIFASSEFYQGGKLNGLAGADQRCRMLAAIAGLERFDTFRAWLSDSSTSASDRLLHSPGRYVLVNGLVVADDWSDLTDGALQRPIDVDENSQTQATVVWTGTSTDGSTAPGSTLCDDWTDHSMGQLAGLGVSDETLMFWTFVDNQWCGGGAVLYCIEQ